MQARISVFTKPWPGLSADELGKMLKEMGFTGVEFPLRKGFQVEPDEAVTELPKLADTLGTYGIKITSVASDPTETAFGACQAVGTGILRIMLGADLDRGYLACEDQWLRDMEAIYPLSEKYGVKIGVQNHFGPGIFATMELRHFLDRCDGKYVGAVWDAAHSALSYEEPEQALDIIWDKLLLVNLKNAYVKRMDLSGKAQFAPYFTLGEDGAISWERIVAYLEKRDYQGDICMPAEYTQEEKVEEYLRDDLEYLNRLLGRSI